MTKYLSFKQAIQVLRVPRVTRSARDSDLFIELSGTPSRPASTSSCCPPTFPSAFFPLSPPPSQLPSYFCISTTTKIVDLSIKTNDRVYFSRNHRVGRDERRYLELTHVLVFPFSIQLRVTQRSQPTGKILRRSLI